MVKILLEGRPGVGKTTVVRRCVVLMQDAGIAVTGFTTSEVRVEGRRIGFRVEGIAAPGEIEGDSAVLASIDYPGPPRVGRYGVDLAAFETVALPTLAAGHGILVIDELGKMELASARFTDQVEQVFSQDRNLLATVHAHRHPFTDRLKERSDVTVVRVTTANRDSLAEQVVARFLE